MYIYSYVSLSTLRSAERAEAWLRVHPVHYQIGPGQYNTFSLDDAMRAVSLAKNFAPGPVFIIKAKVTTGGRERLCRGLKIMGETAYICMLDALRNVRIAKEFSI